VPVGGVTERPNPLDIEVDLPWGMRSVHDRPDALLGEIRHDFGYRENQCGRTGDVVDHRYPGIWGNGVEDCCSNLGWITHRDRESGEYDRRSTTGGNVLGRQIAGLVSVIGEKNLITGLKREAAQQGVGAHRCVGNEGDSIRIGADEFGRPHAGGGHQLREFKEQKLNRVGFHPIL
jgi:hypothetical protein